jgi:hypothetical protein
MFTVELGAANEWYTAASVEFRVGIGSETYRMRPLRRASTTAVFRISL